MLFFMFVSYGTFFPIISMYLTQILHFSGKQTGIILSLSAITAFFSPFITSLIADRVITSEKLFGLLAFFTGILLFIMRFIDDFYIFLLVYTLFSISIGPTINLINAIIFHHTSSKEKEYSLIRVWGTYGWIAAAWIFGYFYLGVLNKPLYWLFYISGFFAILSAFISLTIPEENIEHRGLGHFELLPRDALRVFKSRFIIIFVLIGLLLNIQEKFYYFGTAIFLEHKGFSKEVIMPIMSLGQFFEIFAMLYLPFFLSKLNYKKTMLIGGVLYTLRTAVFMIPFTFFYFLGNAFHGPGYTLFFAPFFIVMDKFSNAKNRAGVQQIIGILFTGVGNIIGQNLAGFFFDLSKSTNGDINFNIYWLVPSLIGVFALSVFYFIFDDKKIPKET